jgi:hypothetical protein
MSVEMSPTSQDPFHEHPLKAWEGVGPDEGMRTRHRVAQLASTLSRSQSESRKASEEIHLKNGLRDGEVHESSIPADQHGVFAEVDGGKKQGGGSSDHKGGLRHMTGTKWQLQSDENAVTTYEYSKTTATTNTDKLRCSPKNDRIGNEIQFHGDRHEAAKEVATPHECNSSTAPFIANAHGAETGILGDWETLSVVGGDGLEIQHTPNPVHGNQNEERPVSVYDLDKVSSNSSSVSLALTNNTAIALAENISVSPSNIDVNMDEDGRSDVTVTSGQEAIDQLRAANADLRSENKFYRLMSEITMKASATRRGCKCLLFLSGLYMLTEISGRLAFCRRT